MQARITPKTKEILKKIKEEKGINNMKAIEIAILEKWGKMK